MFADAADFYECPLRQWIHFLNGRLKNQVHTQSFADLEVPIERTRISRQILVRSKLNRIDKDADDNGAGFAPRCFDQLFVSGMQSAHRRYQSDVAHRFKSASNVLNAVNHPHVRPRCMRARLKGYLRKDARIALRMEADCPTNQEHRDLPAPDHRTGVRHQYRWSE